ncbi:hypothetical protein [uncultured Methanobrevibacter sp.]|nr:hypothetical protein [uncultured Methanobrevibacter sp.]
MLYFKAGLRVLIVCGEKLNPQNIPLIIKVSDSIKEILFIAGFDKILNIV